jgi:hypothetical protein
MEKNLLPFEEGSTEDLYAREAHGILAVLNKKLLVPTIKFFDKEDWSTFNGKTCMKSSTEHSCLNGKVYLR